MRTSRLARDGFKVAGTLSPSKVISRRQTRSFAANLESFNAIAASTEKTVSPKEDPVDDDDNHSDSSLSSAPSSASFDIEDHPTLLVSPSRKRKRGIDSPSTTVTNASTSLSKRSSPRKPRVKAKETNSKGGVKKKARRQPARKTLNEEGEVEIHPPPDWEEIYDAVKEMRKTVLAPVDTMGCESLAEEHLTPKDKRFQTLTALMLSSQTKDTTTALTMHRLQTSLPHPGLTLPTILAISPDTLNTLIHAVGFHNNKTRYIKATALILRDRFGGDIPRTADELMTLPGVGPKMAYLCMSAAWGVTEGIGVDVHVHRITNLWGWHVTKGPEETRKALEAWLPRERWHEINHLLVGFGQTICLPVGRDCGRCTLSERGLCPSAVVGKKKVVKRVKREKVADKVVKEEEEEETEGAVVKTEEQNVVVKEEDILAEEIV